MSLSRVERGRKRTIMKINNLKALKGLKSDRELAELLGCSEGTVSNLRNNPFSVNAGLLIMVEEYLEEETEKMRYVRFNA